MNAITLTNGWPTLRRIIPEGGAVQGGEILMSDGEFDAYCVAHEQERIAYEASRVEEPQTPTQSECIALGEQAVAAAGLTGARLVTLMDLLLQTKEADALASKPKLVALYAWLQGVKATAISGSVAFPPAPHTFEEVVSE